MVQTVEDDGWRIAEQHVRTLAINILAGSLSSSYMIGNLLYRYLDDARLRDDVRADAGLIPAAVEESLRLRGAGDVPVPHRARTRSTSAAAPCTRATTSCSASAPPTATSAVYADAEEFRLDRDGDARAPRVRRRAAPLPGQPPHPDGRQGRARRGARPFAPGLAAARRRLRWECVDHMLEYGPERLDVVVTAAGSR